MKPQAATSPSYPRRALPRPMLGTRRPRILVVADRPGWAIDNKANALQQALAGRYDLVKCFQHELSQAELDSADLVMLFYWLQLLKQPLPEASLARCRDKLLIGICSHFELRGKLREPGCARLRALPTALFANNRALQREASGLLGMPVAYTPNGVDTAFFVPRPTQRKPSRFRVGWTGSLSNMGRKQRGFDDVIVPGVAAVSGAVLHAAIREEQWRTRDQMLEFYWSLDAYVCASRDEGTPNPCLEAAACGVPVVTVPVGNMPELVRDGENGLFFDGTPGDLAAKLRRLREDPGLAASLAARMQESIAQWDWMHQAENYARMFDVVLARNRLAAR